MPRSGQQGINPRPRPCPDSLHIPIYVHTNMHAHNTHVLLREAGCELGRKTVVSRSAWHSQFTSASCASATPLAWHGRRFRAKLRAVLNGGSGSDFIPRVHLTVKCDNCPWKIPWLKCRRGGGVRRMNAAGPFPRTDL